MRSTLSAIGLSGLLVALGATLPVGCTTTAETSPDPGGSGGAGGDTTSGVMCTPSAELCDGVDNDCDGDTDEDCACAEGDVKPCYLGDPDVRGVGQCTDGEQVCDINGQWSACADTGTPDDEVCDGVDNDCDGDVDENQGTVTCGLGICQTTVDACVDNAINPCFPSEPASAEECNGFDDTCEGEVDEGCDCINDDVQPCYTGSQDTLGVGACVAGTQTCVLGQWGACENDVTPTQEVCDGVDNDCNGETDEADPTLDDTCDTGLLGECAPGKMKCVDNDPDPPTMQCVQDNAAVEIDICDGKDNDCDGDEDDEDPLVGMSCSTGELGVCAAGTNACDPMQDMIVCVRNTDPTDDLCDGINNDCDMDTDEADPEEGDACTVMGQMGECAKGMKVCQGMAGLVCEGPSAVQEICGNNLDENCNGTPDDGCTCSDPVTDGGFEGGTANHWTEVSTNFVGLICTEASCCMDGMCPVGLGPSAGSHWLWLGGISQAVEVGTTSQAFTIPDGTAELTFFFLPQSCNPDGTDTFEVKIDTTVVWSSNNSDADCDTLAYKQKTVNIDAFADGGMHTLSFEASLMGMGTGTTNFLVDTVAINACPAGGAN